MTYDHLLLKNTRLSRGISLDRIAFDLCLAERQIHSIENNLKDYFYSDEIKLAAVKKYLRHLGLDESLVLNQTHHVEVCPTYSVSTKEVENLNPDDTVNHHGSSVTESRVEDKVKITNRTQSVNKSKAHEKNDLSLHPVIVLCADYIETHLGYKITLEDLALKTAYSARSIQVIFKKHFQLTPMEYVEERRLLKAKAMFDKFGLGKKVSKCSKRRSNFSFMGLVLLMSDSLH